LKRWHPKPVNEKPGSQLNKPKCADCVEWCKQGIEPFSSWEENAVWRLESAGEHGDVWKPPNKRHESYSLLLASLVYARRAVMAFVQACKDVGQELKLLKALMPTSALLVKSLVNNMRFVYEL
jgi:hypothetical protein